MTLVFAGAVTILILAVMVYAVTAGILRLF